MIVASATKVKGLYCFFDCHDSNEIRFFDCYSRTVLYQKMLSSYVLDSSSYRGKELSLGFNTAVVTSSGLRFHSKSDCRSVFHVEKSGTLRRNILRTGRGIYKRSTVFVSFSAALLSQANLLFA